MKRVSLTMLSLLCSAPFVCSADTGPNPETLLLKDYRPKSIYNIPHTEITKAKYPAIDMHAHAYARTPEQLAQWCGAWTSTALPGRLS